MSGLERESDPRYYGWLVVVVCFVVLFFASGARFAFGVLFDPLLSTYDASRGTVSLIQSTQFLTYAVGVPLVGRLLDRYGAVWIFGGGILFVAAGFGLAAVSPNLLGLFLTLGVMVGIGTAGVSSVAIGVILARWFYRRRGFANGLANTGFNLGQLVIVPVIGLTVVEVGWELSVLGLGAVMLLTLVPTYLVLASGRGRPPAEDADADITRGQLDASSLRQVVGTRSFLGLSISHFCCGFTDFVVAVHIVSYLVGVGYSTPFASGVLGAIGAVSLVGVVVTGRLADRVLTKYLLAVIYVGRVPAFVLLAWVTGTGTFELAALAAFVTLFGFGFYATAPLVSTLSADLYGDELMGTVLGSVGGIHFVGAAAGSFFAGVVFDLSGAYALAFYTSAVVVIVGAVAASVVRERARVVPGATG